MTPSVTHALALSRRSSGRLLALLALLVGASAPVASALNCTWKGVDGAWTDPSKWDCNDVPDADDAVTLTSFSTITLSANATVGSLLLSTGALDGPGNLTITGPFVWGDGGRMYGTGTTIAQGSTQITGQVSVRLGRTLELASATLWNQNNILLDGGTLINKREQTFRDNALPSQSHSIAVAAGSTRPSTIINEGVWVYTGAGTSIVPHFINRGELRVEGEDLRFVGPFEQPPIGRLSGVTQMQLGTQIENAGTTQPGSAISLTARLLVRGGFPMGARGLPHTLRIDIAGPTPAISHDQLAVQNGTVTVDGWLALTFAESFTPAVGQTFEVVSHSGSGGVTGCYDEDRVLVEPASISVAVSCTSTGVVVEVLTVTAGEDPTAPAATALSAPYPNPFAGRTRLDLRVETVQNVTVEVFDVLGRRVATLFDGPASPGADLPLWFEAAGLPPGLYLVHAEGDTFAFTQRAVLTR